MMQATTADGYRLIHEGAITFSQMEANGIRVDVPYLQETISDVGHRIDHISLRLKEQDVWDQWMRKFGAGKANINSTGN